QVLLFAFFFFVSHFLLEFLGFPLPSGFSTKIIPWECLDNFFSLGGRKRGCWKADVSEFQQKVSHVLYKIKLIPKQCKLSPAPAATGHFLFPGDSWYLGRIARLLMHRSTRVPSSRETCRLPIGRKKRMWPLTSMSDGCPRQMMKPLPKVPVPEACNKHGKKYFCPIPQKKNVVCKQWLRPLPTTKLPNIRISHQQEKRHSTLHTNTLREVHFSVGPPAIYRLYIRCSPGVPGVCRKGFEQVETNLVINRKAKWRRRRVIHKTG
ncbi:hypothetical protein QBC38DRAFT_465368, partial [Podospora fimiseda]